MLLLKKKLECLLIKEKEHWLTFLIDSKYLNYEIIVVKLG